MLLKYKKVFQLILQLDPLVLLYTFGYSIATIAWPYAGLLMSTLVLNRLIKGASFHELVLPVFLLALLTMFLGISKIWFDQKRQVHQKILATKLSQATTLQLLKIDYFQLQDPDMRAAYQKAKEGQLYSGGMYTFVAEVTEKLLNGLIALIIGITAIYQLQVSHTTQSGPFSNYLNSPWFTVTLTISLILPVVIDLLLARKSNQIASQRFDTITFINRTFGYYFNTLFNYQYGPVFRLYNANQIFFDKIVGHDQDFYTESLRLDKKSTLIVDGGTCLTSLLLIPIYLLIAMKAGYGAIEVGSVLLFTGYFTELTYHLNEMVNHLTFGNMLVKFLDFYFDFLALTDHHQGSLPVEKRNDNEYVLACEKVGFKYPGTDEWVLRNLDLTLNIGERTAIVGRNGSGKSTLIKLLCRLYPVTEGRITLNGIEIEKYDLKEYQQILAVVFQDFRLFPFTVAENVAANRQFDLARVNEALFIAGVEQRVAAMPHKTATTLYKDLDDQGVDISGGEAQKIAIARAWYKDAPFVILDEPTSALDPYSEYEIYRRFDELVKDKTSIYISHRMSSARFSDRIVVLDGGAVAQDGPHPDLMAQKGLYQELFNAQARYYSDDLTEEQRATLFE